MSEKKIPQKHTEKRPGRYNPEEKSKELIQNVDKICKMRGISRYTLAKGADISTSTIHSLLAGKTKPYMYTVYKLCNALDIPISDLLIEPCDETIENISKEEQELLMLYRKMYTIQAAFAESLPADVNSVSGEVLTGKSSTAHA